MLIGLQMTNEGKLLKVQAATTISEVERRTRNLVSELQKTYSSGCNKVLQRGIFTRKLFSCSF